MHIGCHVSIAKGIQNAPQNASKLGCECFQMFTRDPYGKNKEDLSDIAVKRFILGCKKYKFTNFYVHSPYSINFASANNRIYYGAISAIRRELEVGTKLKARYVMFHPGSAKDLGEKESVKKVVLGIEKILEGYKGTTQLLIENSAGAGKIIGDSFDELGQIVEKVKKLHGFGGICLDTQHSFASGYDWRKKETFEKSLKEFDKYVGLNYLKLFHFNDSQSAAGSHIDRHEHIGKGQIGLEGFKLLVEFAKNKKIDVILETEHDKIKEDLKILKKLRDGL